MFVPPVKAPKSNQAMLRLLSQRTEGLTRGKSNEHPTPEADREQIASPEAAPSASWDFSKIPVFPPDRKDRSQVSSPFTAPSLVSAIQPKLVVGSVNDPLEHEADRVADQVMRMPSPAFSIATAPPQLRRKCAACEEEEAQTLRAKPAGRTPAVSGSEVLGLVHEVLRSPGQPVDAATRRFMERRFGHDFSNVRVHADSQAERSAQAVHARAYTVGRDIVFGAGQYAAHSQASLSLLAHELTHTVQQGAASGLLQRDPKPGAEDEPCPRGEMRLGKGLPCFPVTLPGRDCPIGQVKFGGECIPFRQRPSLLGEKLHLDPTLRPPSASPSSTSTTSGTTTGTTGKGATPKGCKYSVTYANPKEVDCDTVWRAEKGKVPPGPLCGKRVIYEIVSVSVSPSSCPLEGLEVSENVATVPDTYRCTPPKFVWPPPNPCKIGPGGRITGCTDTLTVCGLTSDLHFGGCEEVVTQDILVDGKPVEKHTITFELDVRGTDCTGTVTRK